MIAALITVLFAIGTYSVFVVLLGLNASLYERSYANWVSRNANQWIIALNLALLLAPWIIVVTIFVVAYTLPVQGIIDLQHALAKGAPDGTIRGIVFGVSLGILLALARLFNILRPKGNTPEPGLLKFAATMASYFVAVLIGSMLTFSLQNSFHNVLGLFNSITTPIGSVEINQEFLERSNGSFLVDQTETANNSLLGNVGTQSNISVLLPKLLQFPILLEDENSFQEKLRNHSKFQIQKIHPNIIMLFNNHLGKYSDCLSEVFAREPDQTLVRNAFSGFASQLRALVSGDFGRADAQEVPAKLQAYAELLRVYWTRINELRLAAISRGFAESLQPSPATGQNSHRFPERCTILTRENISDFEKQFEYPSQQPGIWVDEAELERAARRPYLTMLLAILLEMEERPEAAAYVLDIWLRSAQSARSSRHRRFSTSAKDNGDKTELQPDPLILDRQIILTRELLIDVLSRQPRTNRAISSVIPHIADEQIHEIENFTDNFDWKKHYQKRDCVQEFGTFPTEADEEYKAELAQWHLKAQLHFVEAVNRLPAGEEKMVIPQIERANMLYNYLTACKTKDFKQSYSNATPHKSINAEININIVSPVGAASRLGRVFFQYGLNKAKAEASPDLTTEIAFGRARELLELCRSYAAPKDNTVVFQTSLPLHERIAASQISMRQQCNALYEAIPPL